MNILEAIANVTATRVPSHRVNTVNTAEAEAVREALDAAAEREGLAREQFTKWTFRSKLYNL